MSQAEPRLAHHYQTAGGVVIHHQQLLLLVRPSRQEMRLPKGRIDPGETPAITAVRETTEETGYSDLWIVADLGHQVVKFAYGGQSYIRTEFYFLMGLQSQTQIERPL